MFIAQFTTAPNLFLSWAKSIQSIPPSHLLKIYFNIIFDLLSKKISNSPHALQSAAIVSMATKQTLFVANMVSVKTER